MYAIYLFCQLTCGGDVAAEPEEKLVSFTHGELRRGLFWEAGVAPGSQFGQLPAEISAGQSSHQDDVRLVLSTLEDDGDSVAADRLLQLLRQGGETARLQWREETHHQQPERRDGRKVKKWSSAERLDCCRPEYRFNILKDRIKNSYYLLYIYYLLGKLL